MGLAAVLFAAVLTGCYEKFNDPGPAKVWTDEEVTAEGYRIVTIETLKALFETNVGDPTTTATYDKAYIVQEDYAIKGKVISNDAYGNFYRTLYIQDAGGFGIEVKIGLGSMYTEYPAGSTMFVLCKGLALGNYRKNLSLGIPEAEGGDYANAYMDVQSVIDAHILKGAKTHLAQTDTLVITSANIGDYCTTNGYEDIMFSPELSGRLVRFENAVCTWVTTGDNIYPSFQTDKSTNYQNILYTTQFDLWKAYDEKVAASKNPELVDKPAIPRPANFYSDYGASTWAFQAYKENIRYYGNTRFELPGTVQGQEKKIPIIIRTSGYSRFALDHVPENNAVVNITGIVNLYTSRTGGYAANQVMINNSTDVEVLP